jgi:hypothetical protein
VSTIHGPVRWDRWYFELYKSYVLHAIVTIIALITQTVFLALHREWRDPLWRWAAVVVVYFWCISFLSWEEHFTITRHALPITLVFNLLLAKRPGKAWLIWFLLGNCFVPFGVRYFDRKAEAHSPPPAAEFAIATAPAIPSTVLQVLYGEGWSTQQWSPKSTWRWSRSEKATLVLRNSGPVTLPVELRFVARSFHVREFRVQLGTRTIYEGQLPAVRQVIVLKSLELPPGETVLTFVVSGQTSKADDGTPGDVTFKMEKPQVVIGPH